MTPLIKNSDRYSNVSPYKNKPNKLQYQKGVFSLKYIHASPCGGGFYVKKILL